MKIIFLATDINSRIRTMLKLKFSAEMAHVKSGEEAKVLLEKEEDICLIIGDSNVDSIDELIDLLEKTFSIIPFIDISEGEVTSAKAKTFLEAQDDIVRAPTPIDPKVLEGIVASSLDVFRNRLNDQYREIKIDHLRNLDQAVCSIFVKLSPTKYIKYIEKGSEFTGEIIEDLVKRKVKKLYVDKESIGEFSNLATQKLVEKFDDENLTSEDKHLLSIVSNETIKQNLKNLGVSPLTLELGHKTLVSTASNFSQEKKLDKLLELLTKSTNYEAEHCVMASYIGMAMINISDWNTPENHLKICSAALLHDASLIGTGLGMIGDQSSTMFKKLDEKQKKIFLKNPEVSADILLKCKIFPHDAHTIVLQQGERPGGKGFPKALDSTQVKPLSCIFILAHDFIHKIYHLGMSPENKGIVLAELEAKYDEGNFLKAYQLLERSLA